MEIVVEKNEGLRIDKYLSFEIEELSRNKIQKLLENGHILVNQKSVNNNYKVSLGDKIEILDTKSVEIPDLLPSDIIGTQTFNSAKSTFETKMGPVYANFVLLDEINRSSAKTQSAMLEAMQERQVTIGGILYPLPSIFIVISRTFLFFSIISSIQYYYSI